MIPAVCAANFEAVRSLAHSSGDAYAIGIHPLYVPQAQPGDVQALAQALARWHTDPRLVAVGEIGLDYFVPALCEPAMRQRQQWFYQQQLALAQQYRLPLLLHARRSLDELLQPLRAQAGPQRSVQTQSGRGIVHAFNGSAQQAAHCLALGLKLGFGGAATFTRAARLRRLLAELPLSALVLETDAPDMPPRWLYRDAAARAGGAAQGLNSPAELPRIGAELAALRGLEVAAFAAATRANALDALPGLRAPCFAG